MRKRRTKRGWFLVAGGGAEQAANRGGESHKYDGGNGK